MTEATIYDIAESLNISAQTVSRSFKKNSPTNSVTKEKVMNTAKALSFEKNIFAKNLSIGKTISNNIGLILPKIDDPNIIDIISGIERSVNEHGYNLIINQSFGIFKKERILLQSLFNERISGLILWSSSIIKAEKSLVKFHKKNIPLIGINYKDISNLNSLITVKIDYEKANLQAMNYLTDQGCKKIFFLFEENNCDQMMAGFKEVSKRLQISNICYMSFKTTDELTRLVSEIDTSNTTSKGIIFSGSEHAITFMKQLKIYKAKEPNNIHIIAFNHNPFFRIVEPRLPLMNFNGEKFGELAAEMLFSAIKTEHQIDPCFEYDLFIPNVSLTKFK